MCQSCAIDFGVLVRRHHCRACGKVVCATCSGNRAPLRYRDFESARVCDECYEFLDKGLYIKMFYAVYTVLYMLRMLHTCHCHLPFLSLLQSFLFCSYPLFKLYVHMFHVSEASTSLNYDIDWIIAFSLRAFCVICRTRRPGTSQVQVQEARFQQKRSPCAPEAEGECQRRRCPNVRLSQAASERLQVETTLVCSKGSCLVCVQSIWRQRCLRNFPYSWIWTGNTLWGKKLFAVYLKKVTLIWNVKYNFRRTSNSTRASMPDWSLYYPILAATHSSSAPIMTTSEKSGCLQ